MIELPARINYFSKAQDKIIVLIKKRITKFKSFLKKSQSKKERKMREKEVEEAPKPRRFRKILFWSLEALFTGLALNFMLWQLAGFQISYGKILGWGIAYYFISAELPQIFVECRRGVKR